VSGGDSWKLAVGSPPSLPLSLHFGGQESYGGYNRQSDSRKIVLRP